VQDVCPRWGLRLEVPLDDGGELLERVEDREVQLAEDVGREDETAMTVDHERLHDTTSTDLRER
jgi:hypothetical protein